MKLGSSQLFPLVLVSCVAALSFWLQQAVQMEDPRRDGKQRHDPDSIAENYEMRRFDETGTIKYRLTGPHMMHFPDDDTALLKSPVLVAYRPDAPPMTLSGDHAKVTAQAETVFLWDNVVAHRAATPDRAALTARMPDLVIQPDLAFAFTNSPVEITQGKSWVRGTGAELDNNAATLVLRSQVTGLYIRPTP